MARQIGEDTKITLDLKTIGMILAGVVSLVGMWFALQADIEDAKELPSPAHIPNTPSNHNTATTAKYCSKLSIDKLRKYVHKYVQNDDRATIKVLSFIILLLTF